MSKSKKQKKKVKKPKNKKSINSKFEDFTGLLFKDQEVSSKLDILYMILKKSEKDKERFREIELILDECTKSLVPNYCRFYEEINNLSDINLKVAVPNFESLINIGQFSTSPTIEIYVVLLFREYKKECELNLDKPLERMNHKNFAKFKLLYGYVSKMEERYIRAIVDGLKEREDEYLDEGLEKLDWSQLKDRFMKAIMHKEKSTAFKLLGRLSNLDPGESYYFEALAHYNNNEYDDAIRFAKKITPNNVDYYNAVSMILKCYALKGDFNKFIDYLFKENQIKINTYYFLYLMQILVCNTNNLIEVTNGLREKIEIYKPEEPIGDNSDHIISQQELCRNSAKLALERMELLEEIELYSDETGNGNEMPDELGNRFIQVTIALEILPKIGEILTKENMTKEELSQRISNLLLNNYIPQFEDIYLALNIQLRLNIRKDFIDSVTSNSEKLLLYKDERAWELLEAAYVESIIIGNNEIQLKLSELLESAGRFDNRRLDEFAIDIQIKNNLSKSGRIAYESAEWQYQKAISEDYGWKDAGMISLSYFRIIEVEINQKLIIPTINLIGVKNIKKTYEEALNSNDEKDKKDIGNKWRRIIYDFESIEKGTIQGVMLGSIEKLFGAIKLENLLKDKADYSISKLLYDNIIKLVTEPKGIEAINTGKISDFVKYENREKYRNPPAHTRYLHINVAKECKEFVNNSLLQMFTWIN